MVSISCVIAISAIFLSVLLLQRGREFMRDTLSKFLNIILCFIYPIPHTNSGSSIPTCSYQFPNGQGNIAKFLEGASNSYKWGKKYGGLYRIWSGMTGEIVLTRPEHVKAAFYDSDKHFKATNNNSGYIMQQLLGQCVGLVSLARWKRLKSVVEMPFLHHEMPAYVDLVQRHIQMHFNDLVHNRALESGTLDPVTDLRMLPFSIVASIIYGDLSFELKSQLRDIGRLREAVFQNVINGGVSRFCVSQYLPLDSNRQLRTFKEEWAAFNASEYRRALQTGSETSLSKMYHEVEKKTITEEELLQTLDEMLFANLDVTMGGVSWSVVLLAANTRVRKKLKEEIQAQRLHDDDNKSFEKFLLSSSSYVHACMLESARLKPLAAFSVPQSAPSERILDGFLIPAGTNLIVDTHALNINNEFWGEDRKTFRPERFLERKGTELRYNFWRYGFGPRQCMGKYIADLIIRALLVYLFENFNLGILETDENWDRVLDMWIYHPQIKLRCTSLKLLT